MAEIFVILLQGGRVGCRTHQIIYLSTNYVTWDRESESCDKILADVRPKKFFE